MAYRKKTARGARGGYRSYNRRGSVQRKSYSRKAGSARGGFSRSGGNRGNTLKIVVEQTAPREPNMVNGQFVAPAASPKKRQF